MRKVFLSMVLATLSLGLLFLGGLFQARAQELSEPVVKDVTDTCLLDYDKTASPDQVDAGGVTTVTFELQSVGDCSPDNSPVDVILVIDRSGSMSGKSIEDAKSAAGVFVGNMTLPPDRVGVASFAGSGSGRLDSGLTDVAADVIVAVNGLRASGLTDMEEGLETAETELLNNGEPDHAPVIIILSDGHHNESTAGELQATADRIKREGIRIISIGLGSADEHQLKSIASSADDYYYAPTSAGLCNIYHKISSVVRVSARDMVITDTLSIYDSLVPNSFRGPVIPTVNGDQILWHISAVPTSSITLSYQAVMTDTAGTWETNDSAIASYIATGSVVSITFPSPTVTVLSQCGQPALNDVQPGWGCVGKDVMVTLMGSGFVNPSATIGSKNLTVHTCQHDVISATLSAGLDAGVYDANVTNECAKSAVLRDAFVLYPAPGLLSIRPKEGYNTTPSDLTICGEVFAPGTKVFIEDPVSGTIELENQGAYGTTCLVGTVPAGLQPGEHDIIVQNLCGEITGTYRVLAEDLNDDLWAMREELWLSPSICARECDDISMGLIVHRRGGKDPLQNVAVRFYEGNPSLGATLIGTGTIPLLSPRVSPAERIAGFSTSAVDWTPSQGVMSYTLYAVIDPHNVISEDIEINNVVSRTVQVLPCTPQTDRVAPRVDAFEIQHGADTTYDVENSLALSATDYPWPGPNAGVAWMNFVEYLFNDAANVWIPVQVSGWLPFTEMAHWDLYPEGGMRFLQVWVSDGAGNISRYPNFKYINYVEPCAAVSRDGVRIYRKNVEVGDVLHIEVVPCSGDPDLYVWPSDWQQGAPPWVSNQSGDVVEQLSIPITVTGEYQVEVYGYTAARYNINIEVDQASSQKFHALLDAVTRTTSQVMDKPSRTNPIVPPTSKPGTDVIPVGPAPYIEYAQGTLQGVLVDGPETGSVGATHTYTATVLPQDYAGTAGWPITYTWEATGQAPVVHLSGAAVSSTDTVTFMWMSASPTTKTITVTVSGGSGPPVFDVHETVITGHTVYLPLVIRNP